MNDKITPETPSQEPTQDEGIRADGAETKDATHDLGVQAQYEAGLADRTLGYNHAVLNYLNAVYQGRYAHFNVLLQILNQPALQNPISETEGVLEKIDHWFSRLWQGEYLFSLRSPEITQEEPKYAFALLLGGRQELFQLGCEIELMLRKQDFHNHTHENFSVLIAAFARYAYARDNYSQGFIELAKYTENKAQEQFYQNLIKAGESDIEISARMLEGFQKIESLPPPLPFCKALFAECAPLHGYFRSYAHDIVQLCSLFLGEFDYQMAGIPEDQWSTWKDIGIAPIEAGYWYAHAINADEALLWTQKGIVNYRVAGEWRSWLFPAEEASKWLKAGFTPRDASDWANAQLTPEEAKSFQLKGYQTPYDVPREKLKKK